MNHSPIDLRSDTVTKPTAGMRQAMLAAEVGDDVFGEDPTVIRLQERVAELLGKEAALFVPSGTMGNQIAVRLHCRPGDEVLLEGQCHIYTYEQGGFAQLSGVSARPIEGEFGVLRLDQLREMIRPDNEHFTRTRLLCLENTHNRGGGRVQPLEETRALTAWARGEGLATHLDGARLFNASVASGVSPREWASHFDTVNVCLSKGLGAPVGSALAGPADLIREAVRHRKLFGGAMRQSGILAAAGLYALENNIDRLAEDHQNARRLADALREIPGITLRPERIDTNLVIFDLAPKLGTAAEFAAKAERQGTRVIPFGPRSLRAVTHLDVSSSDIERASAVLRNCALTAG